MKDPKKLRHQKPDYVQDVSGTDDPDHQPQVGSDPMDPPVEGTRKPVVHLDEEKVRRHDAESE